MTDYAKGFLFKTLNKFAKGNYALNNIEKDMLPDKSFFEEAILKDKLEKQYIESQ